MNWGIQQSCLLRVSHLRQHKPQTAIKHHQTSHTEADGLSGLFHSSKSQVGDASKLFKCFWIWAVLIQRFKQLCLKDLEHGHGVES